MTSHNKLFVNKIEARKSDIHGWGVFALTEIEEGDIIEECHFMGMSHRLYDHISDNNGFFDIWMRYAFMWDPEYTAFDHGGQRSHDQLIVIPFGFGCIYNSTKNANADWDCDTERKLLIFKALRKIQPDEEICHNYEAALRQCKNAGVIT